MTALTSGQPAHPDFNSFWQNFKTAVKNNDRNAVAGMVNYPFETYEYDRTIKTRTKLAFLKLYYKDIFDGEVDANKCFAKAKPTRESAKSYTVGCAFRSDSSGEEPFVYGFVLTKTGWKFASFANINE